MNDNPSTLSRDASRFVVPDAGALDVALGRTTHLGVGTHPDDLEIMAWHGIATCYASEEDWFSGVVVTTGAASPGADAGNIAGLVARRLDEQIRAAERGRYALLVYLGYESPDIKQPSVPSLARDLDFVLAATRPRVVYTHSPFDSHASHVAVLAHLVAALHRLPAAAQPEALYGCEVWDSLDWLPECCKVRFDVSAHVELNRELIALHASQLEGGKRYDLATLGRKQAHATFDDAHDVDRASAVEFAVDLTPLLRDPTLALADFARRVIDTHAREVAARLAPYAEPPWKS